VPAATLHEHALPLAEDDDRPDRHGKWRSSGAALPPAFPVLMVLDEFAGLKRMEVIEHAAAQIASYGVKPFFVLQSLEQLKAVYKDNWETFLSNSGLKVFFSLDDHFSREYVSKLVGETEVIREVRSASDSESEIGKRFAQHGTSASRSSSVSEGTNRSATDSVSGGTNSSVSRSKGRSWGQSWTPKGLFGIPKNEQDSRGRNFSTSRTEGNIARMVAFGQRRHVARHVGIIWTTSSETYGTTEGTSTIRTTGASEPSRSGHWLRLTRSGIYSPEIDDAEQIIYPGLALIVISGERTIALQRVNYLEDCEFCQAVRASSRYPSLLSWKELTVSFLGLGPYSDFLVSAGIPRKITGWLVNVGQIVSRGEAVVSLGVQDTTVYIRSPYTGMITKLQGEDSKGAFSSFFRSQILRGSRTRDLSIRGARRFRAESGRANQGANVQGAAFDPAGGWSGSAFPDRVNRDATAWSTGLHRDIGVLGFSKGC